MVTYEKHPKRNPVFLVKRSLKAQPSRTENFGITALYQPNVTYTPKEEGKKQLRLPTHSSSKGEGESLNIEPKSSDSHHSWYGNVSVDNFWHLKLGEEL